MKTTNFKLKAKDISFTSVKFMSDKEKLKVYKDFIKFLNNHFKSTTFSKALYNHFHLHCGFIAHYNINGFYGEYFETPMKFHKASTGYAPSSEYIGYVKIDPSKKDEYFADIGKELYSSGYDNLGGFFRTIMNCNNSRDYEDLNLAIQRAFIEYREAFEELFKKAAKEIKQEIKQEIKEVVVNAIDFEDVITDSIEPTTYKTVSQTSLFDFL